MSYSVGNRHGRPGCLLDDVSYHEVEIEKILRGCTSVPVTVDDHGKIYKTVMVAGSVGARVTSSGEMLDEPNVPHKERSARYEAGKWAPVDHKPLPPTGGPVLDSLQPESGWYILLFMIILAIFVLQKLHVVHHSCHSRLDYSGSSTHTSSLVNLSSDLLLQQLIVSTRQRTCHSCIQLIRIIGGCMTDLKILKQRTTRKGPWFKILTQAIFDRALEWYQAKGQDSCIGRPDSESGHIKKWRRVV